MSQLIILHSLCKSYIFSLLIPFHSFSLFLMLTLGHGEQPVVVCALIKKEVLQGAGGETLSQSVLSAVAPVSLSDVVMR